MVSTMNTNPLAHPEDWADYIIIVPEEPFAVCKKCLNKKMGECLGKDKCPLIRRNK